MRSKQSAYDRINMEMEEEEQNVNENHGEVIVAGRNRGVTDVRLQAQPTLESVIESGKIGRR